MDNDRQKEASSEVAWALLMEGITEARVELHRLKHLTTRCMKLVESSARRDHLYQVAGDIIQDVPKRISRIENVLDRTALALSGMGDKFLSARLPLSDKLKVEEATLPAFGGSLQRSSKRVARIYLQRKLRGK